MSGPSLLSSQAKHGIATTWNPIQSFILGTVGLRRSASCPTAGRLSLGRPAAPVRAPCACRAGTLSASAAKQILAAGGEVQKIYVIEGGAEGAGGWKVGPAWGWAGSEHGVSDGQAEVQYASHYALRFSHIPAYAHSLMLFTGAPCGTGVWAALEAPGAWVGAALV